ncbi:ABC transporter permease subunit [Clostridium sp.]|uniref:ABC transporter permease subunit n=1 Tax=Clostridium sp. TaxID=1506 RepID=UPI00261D38BC|nr:ABC transporter permease subunit [Clostridium sp.]
MNTINRYLYDNLDREYERKNLYLKEIAILQEDIKNSDRNEKLQLKDRLNKLKKNKDKHNYNKELLEFKKNEKEFLKNLNEKIKVFKYKNGTLLKKVNELEVRLFEAKEKMTFYKKNINFTYEAELIYKQSKVEIEQIPPVIEFAKMSKVELDKAYKALSELSDEDEKKFQEEFKKYKEDENRLLKDNIKTIKSKNSEGLISEKAKDEGVNRLKRLKKDRIIIKSFESKKTYYTEIVKNKKYELNKVLKQKVKTVNINVADIRRIVPIEVYKVNPTVSYLTFLLPGLGQLINKQYIKSIIMFLATIYIYIIAIPYALGFGNYKGEGIAGLISLAKDAGRLDRSIIFMVEGIVAIIFLVIALVLIILSFKDVNKVEKDEIRGIRVRSWCETKQTLEEEGLPYLVSMPALVIIVFIVFIPIITTILLSMTGMDPEHQAKFGWDIVSNYKMIFMGEGMAGSIFWKILLWTIIWTICATSLGIFLGFALALLLNNERIKGKKFFRSVYLLPWAVPAFITIMFFSILSSPNGVLTEMLSKIFGEGLQIKNNAFVSKIVIICIQGWLGSAYVFLLATGVLQSINKDLYEAADIDGASSFKKLIRITIPLVLFQTAPLLVGQYTFNFNNFSNIYLFNSGGPFNPVIYGNLAGETDILISYIYKLTMENQYQALGAAITIIISIALMVISYIGYINTDAFRKEK